MVDYDAMNFWTKKGKEIPFGISKYSTAQSDLASKIAEVLPHGSGIDADWHIDEKGDKIYAYNSYHAMDEYGFYYGWQDFYIVIPKHNLEDFKLHFQGRQYIAQRWSLRDYLEDIIAEALRSIK